MKSIRKYTYSDVKIYNDHEGITGYETFRSDLGLMYFLFLDTLTGKLTDLRMMPTQMKRFRMNQAVREDAIWLRDTLNREGERFGTQAELHAAGFLTLRWAN